MSKKTLSMTEVAEIAGVSIATISRIVNNKGGYSPETKDKVLQVIKETGFISNSNAKSLRTNISNTIGVIVPDITNEFFARIVRSIDMFFLPKGYSVLICDTNELEKTEDLHFQNLISKNVDGIIYISGHSDVSKIEEMYSIPIVYIDRSPKNSKLLVKSDNKTGGYLAGKLLAKSGCKDLIMLRDIRNISPVQDRYEGFREAVLEADIDFSQDHIYFTEVDYLSAKSKITNLLEDGIRFDGIFASNDTIALASLHALQEFGLKVPEEVKLVGFDDISATEYCNPSITTIRQDTKTLGKLASKMLLEIIENGSVERKSIIVPVEAIERKTTDSNIKDIV